MSPAMLLHKTELARAILARTGTELGRRERQVLILCDGQRSLDAIVSMFGVESLGMIQSLIASGHLAHGATTTPVAPARAPAPPVAATAPPSTLAAPRTQPSRRSMAACKMYMIDMLQLQRTPEAASLAVALQTAVDDDERV